MEYTKGEWEVRQLPITKELYVACGTRLIASGLTGANARLIAQAPRLYEACKEALRAIDQFEKVVEWEEHCPVYLQVAQAIAEAGGK